MDIVGGSVHKSRELKNEMTPAARVGLCRAAAEESSSNEATPSKLVMSDSVTSKAMRNAQTSIRRVVAAALFLSLVLNGVINSDRGNVKGFALNPAAPISAALGGKFNGKIAFTSNRHNTGLSIWTMNADGGNPTRLTDEKSRPKTLPGFIHVYDDTPAWSPDGTKIAFVTGGGLSFGLQNPSSDIYTINSNGTGLTKLMSDSGENGGFTWSPDGKQIAFASNRDPDGRSRIWVMNSDGSNQRRLTDIHDVKNPVFYQDMTPSWSPDGSKILFTGSRDFNGTRNCYAVNCSELFVMNADGSNDHAITSDPNRGGIYMFPKWSPDGTKIVTSVALGTIGDRVNGLNLGTEIIVMDADGGNQINLSYRSDLRFVDAAVDWQ